MGETLCPRCNKTDYHEKDCVCWDCKKELGKEWIRVYREMQLKKVKEKIKVTFRRNKQNIIIKETELNDNCVVCEEASPEERKEFITKEKMKKEEERAKKMGKDIIERSAEIVKAFNGSKGTDKDNQKAVMRIAKQILNNSAGVS